jgi:hypothetical protein
MSNPHVITIEGRRALVIERTPPLPAHLDTLLQMMAVTVRAPIRIGGWRPECGQEQHRFQFFAEGTYRSRRLRLLQCADCEGVQVRDVTLDRLADLGAGRARYGPKGALRRRDHILGWYSGARRNQRTYGLPMR